MDRFRRMSDTQRFIDPATIGPTLPPLSSYQVVTGQLTVLAPEAPVQGASIILQFITIS
ncbi:exosporium leader peptide-containing protein [Bacillus mycoides]|uniref:exosporium leader peptide-containing protein n=1 Tax=Bacillus mycoides TaxID=1405 RepID=UPI003CFD8FA6